MLDGMFRHLLGPSVRPAITTDSVLKNDVLHYTGRQPTDYVDGRYFTEYVEVVRRLKREKRYSEAEALLLAICDAMERGPHAPAPWYYEQLAIIYRKLGRHADELAILQRGTRPHPEHVRPGVLHARLTKLKAKRLR